MSSPLALSPHARLVTDLFGTEQQPIACIDEALPDPQAVVNIAARHDFRPIGPFYPGVRAAVSQQVAMPLVQPLLPLLEQTFGLSRPSQFLECFLSLITVQAADLKPIQRFPHFDGVEESRLAVLLYLDQAETTGTAFYRQRATGFESVDAERLDEYRTRLEREVAHHGLPEAGYIGTESALFERIFTVAGRFNRMVIYRGNALHCADVPAGFVPEKDPRKGRLTLNLFLR
ncbi:MULTISPECIES: DUF6445 family protein [unclassified Novosphingobium]|uniref:DUF6445 family protein n=1 Tax=unclassified Novosphingobium TaxID=2644732 RepID=UPI0025DBEE90|nr:MULTISPECIES: DUF6445 family protein [unclassified Novosphingobium]HQS69079.1 DUF6445 family protein [Novosphingobium sp.]